MILSAENIVKAYVETKVLDNVSLYINDSDKIGVVGVNGTGKSTLLRIIAGEIEEDSGNIIKSNANDITYLPQNPIFDDDDTVLNAALSISTSNKTQEYQIKSFLTKLGLTEFDVDVKTLSGGQKKRVALAGVLASTAKLLILDEPTNHIDNSMVEWLENYLINYKGALLMITHDRYFLDRVCNRIIEIDRGSLYNYNGNYSAFLEIKAQREEMQIASDRKRQSILRGELAWMQRGARARSTKQKARIERFDELKNKENFAALEKVQIDSLSSRLGGKTIEINNISKSYGENLLIKDFSYIISRSDRIGIVGKNGIGKSTLMKILCGAIQPDSGEIVVGETVKIGFFTQEYDDMDESLKVIDYIRSEAEYIQLKNEKISASQMLERFLFSPEIQWTTISKLSGGEKRRLYLLKILISAPNILFLDEPTNDLDIMTLAVLEDYLDTFNGAVVCVSHDRYFLDRVVTHIFSFEGNAVIKEYNGGFSDYLDNRGEEIKEKTVVKNESRIQSKSPKKLKLTYKEQKEYDCIEETILNIENEIENISQQLQEVTSDYVLLQELTHKQKELEEKLEYTMERWEYLSILAQKIEEGELVK